MKLKKKWLKNSHLYIIVDKKNLKNRSIYNVTGQIRDSGVDIVQYRDKESKKENILETACALRKVLLKTKTIFIINDYLDIAKIVDTDGIHLGQDDVPVAIARKILGKDKIIGISCHSLKQAKIAQSMGADYISIGPIFFTSTKPEYKATGLDLIKKVKKEIRIPFFAIGGISKKNIDKVKSKGAKRVVICKAICQAKNISSTIKNISQVLYK
jgi:thiamine-phosphate pyrophosphorylase